MLPIDLKDSFEKLTLGYLLFFDSKDKMGRDNFLTQKLKHLKKKSICAHEECLCVGAWYKRKWHSEGREIMSF